MLQTLNALLQIYFENFYLKPSEILDRLFLNFVLEDGSDPNRDGFKMQNPSTLNSFSVFLFTQHFSDSKRIFLSQ